jgi:hypothetical protein
MYYNLLKHENKTKFCSEFQLIVSFDDKKIILKSRH